MDELEFTEAEGNRNHLAQYQGAVAQEEAEGQEEQQEAAWEQNLFMFCFLLLSFRQMPSSILLML